MFPKRWTSAEMKKGASGIYNCCLAAEQRDKLDFTEGTCYRERCSALTLRIIISISALPNSPK